MSEDQTRTPHTPNEPEPSPAPNQHRPVWELVIEDMRERDHVGRAKYGTPLQPFNGRDAMVDGYQEVLDLAVYLRQVIAERDTQTAQQIMLRGEARLHDLKCWPESFTPLWTRDKTHEVRPDDRGYRVGDVLVLHEYDPEEHTYTGRVLLARVTHVLPGGQFGIERGHVVLSLRDVTPYTCRP